MITINGANFENPTIFEISENSEKKGYLFAENKYKYFVRLELLTEEINEFLEGKEIIKINNIKHSEEQKTVWYNPLTWF
jgi:predicted house-cleaning noncanonical NTP pyrophosphatase (MazG superfamily)